MTEMIEIAGRQVGPVQPVLIIAKASHQPRLNWSCHPSLLPDYKEYNFIKDAFQDGEEFMGVTVHHMVNPNGNGQASTIILDQLKSARLDDQSLQRRFYDIYEVPNDSLGNVTI